MYVPEASARMRGGFSRFAYHAHRLQVQLNSHGRSTDYHHGKRAGGEMTQNIYDDEAFFERYSELPRSRLGLEGAPEWPSLRALLPDLFGSSVIDLGCGFGWFCRWARENGASRVVGLDVSARMLERARAMTDDEAIEYRRADLDSVELPPESSDLAYSSLALHYLRSLDRLLAQVYDSLRPGGRFVFSVEHPLFTAPSNPGWSTNSAGRKVWPLDSYLLEGPRVTDWLAEGVVKQHRTLATYLNTLIRHGFRVERIIEWGPTDAQLSTQAELADELHRPTFLLIAAARPSPEQGR
jgi:SAM-dependent methyltransferase